MKHVYPTGFILRQEKNLRDLNGMPTGQQMTIDANFEEVKTSRGVKDAISQTVLITRKNIFESALVEIAKKHHQVVMSTSLLLNFLILNFWNFGG